MDYMLSPWLKIHFFVTKAATIAHVTRRLSGACHGYDFGLVIWFSRNMEIVVLGLAFVVQYLSVIVFSADHESQQRYVCVNQTLNQKSWQNFDVFTPA